MVRTNALDYLGMVVPVGVDLSVLGSHLGCSQELASLLVAMVALLRELLSCGVTPAERASQKFRENLRGMLFSPESSDRKFMAGYLAKLYPKWTHRQVGQILDDLSSMVVHGEVDGEDERERTEFMKALDESRKVS